MTKQNLFLYIYNVYDLAPPAFWSFAEPKHGVQGAYQEGCPDQPCHGWVTMINGDDYQLMVIITN